MKKILFILLGIALLPLATAFSENDVSVDESISLNQDQIVNVVIENNSLADKELEIDLIGPKGLFYNFESVPEEIESGEKAVVRMELYRSNELEGASYQSTLIVKLDEEIVMKKIRISVSNFVVSPEEPQEQDAATGTENTILTGFFSLASIGNLDTFITYILVLLVVVLALIFIAKIISNDRNQRREFQ